MSDQMYKLTIKAEGEVRDKDGNLISRSDVDSDMVLDREQVLSVLNEEDRRAFIEGEDTP